MTTIEFTQHDIPLQSGPLGDFVTIDTAVDPKQGEGRVEGKTWRQGQ